MYFFKEVPKKLAIPFFRWIASRRYIYYQFCELYNTTIVSGKIKVRPKNIKGVYTLYAKSHIASRLLISDYESSVVNAINKLNFIDGIVVNIGANVGLICIHVALTFKNCEKVIAIEPNIDALNLLNENVAQNCVEDKIEVINACVGKSEGYIDLFYIPEIPEYSSIGSEMVHQSIKDVKQESYQVKMIRLDKLKVGKINLIIIDTEGAEYIILEGSISVLLKDYPILLFECEELLLNKFGNSSADIFKLLNEQGYNMVNVETGKIMKNANNFKGEILAFCPEKHLSIVKLFNL